MHYTIKTSLHFLFSFLALVSITCSAQTFQKTIGGPEADYAIAMLQLSDGSYVTCGNTSSFNGFTSQIFIVKTSTFGDTLWTRIYKFSLPDYATDLKQTNDGGFIITGTTFLDQVNYDELLLMKVTSDGTLEWAKAIGGVQSEKGRSVIQTSDGGYAVTGYTTSYGAGFEDIYLVKTNSVGEIEWTKTYGGSVTDDGYQLWQNSDGGYTIASSIRSFLTTNAGGLMRTNNVGDIIWCKSVNSQSDDGFYSLYPVGDGSYVAAGYTSIGLNYDFLFVKADDEGDMVWQKQIGGGGDNRCYKVKQADDGGFALAGYYVNMGLGADAYLVRTDAQGDTLWTATYGGPGDDQGKDILFAQDGGYVICGHTASTGFGNGDFYNVKTDANGNSGCSEFHPLVELVIPTTLFEDWEPDTSSGGTITDITTIPYSAGYIHTNCSSVGVENLDGAKHVLVVYPNPASSVLNINFDSKAHGKMQVNLLDNVGRTVHTELRNCSNGNNTFFIDVNRFAGGIYQLQVMVNGEITTKKFVVE